MNLASARHAFVTGGASGIGLGIADALAQRGLAVTLADVDRNALETTLASRSDRYAGQVLDVRDRDGWIAVKMAAETQFGAVNILVNNAGIGPDGRELADMEPLSFDRVIAINLTGVFNGIATFAADLRARRMGHIVNVASMAGLAGQAPGIGAYTAAKFGVVGLSEVLRREIAPHGVGVSVLCPGLVATNIGATTIKLGSSVRNSGGTMAGGLDPAKVGDMVADGIERDQLYIATHPDRWSGVEKRMQELAQAFGRQGAR